MMSTHAIVLLSLLAVSYACSCGESTAKEIFCRSDFVSKVRISHEMSNSRLSVYTVKHLHVFKKPDDEALGTEVVTATQSATCGVNLYEGQDIVIAGTIHHGHLFITACSTIEPDFETAQFAKIACPTRHAAHASQRIANAPRHRVTASPIVRAVVQDVV